MEMPVDGDCVSFHFSFVLDGCNILPPEQSLHSSSKEFTAVTGFVTEENDVSNLGNLALFLPG